jgi:hypothetical protein
VEEVIAGAGFLADIEELEGPSPSPSVLIDGTDVTGRSARRPSIVLAEPAEPATGPPRRPRPATQRRASFVFLWSLTMRARGGLAHLFEGLVTS